MSSSAIMLVGVMGCMGMVCSCVVGLSLLTAGGQMLGGEAGGDAEVSMEDVGSEVPRAGPGCVFLYEDEDGQGQPLEACLDGRKEWSIASFKSVNEGYNDKASAMDVGSGVRVRLYEHANFNDGGRKKGKVMIKQRPEWVNLKDAGFDNQASSLKIYKV
jgi:hypothetical protein